MKNLQKGIDRFFWRNRDKGIPNLMLYIAIGTFIVTLLGQLGYGELSSLLAFNYSLILQGQVWRLITFIFTMQTDVFSSLLLLYCFYSLGNAVESYMGTLKFNLYVFSGILLMAAFGMIFGGFTIADGQVLTGDCSFLFAGDMAFWLYLSLILCFSTLSPDSQFLLLFIIPIKAWVMSLFYLIYIAYLIISMALHWGCFPQYLFPLVGLANYFLFFAKDMKNLLPLSWRAKLNRKSTPPKRPQRSGPIPFPGQKANQASFTHKCTVCGRTDVSDPKLEFRYCSRCKGYFCYCEDHISNHSHIE